MKYFEPDQIVDLARERQDKSSWICSKNHVGKKQKKYSDEKVE